MGMLSARFASALLAATLVTSVLAENPASDVPLLNAKVTALRFFEGGYRPLPREQRKYDNRFEQSKTKYVSWELNLEHPAPSQRVPFVIRSVWYRPDGSILTRQSLPASLDNDSSSSYHTLGRGGAWKPGLYQVDLYVEGTKIASGSFEIYEAGSQGDSIAKGLDYLSKGMADAAIAEFTKALKINPRDAAAYNARGATYHFKKQYDDAIADFNAALAIDAKHSHAHNNRAEAYKEKGQYDLAIADYSRALQINPMNAKAYKNRAETYVRKGQYNSAIADYTKLLEIDPKDATAYTNRGVIYYLRQQFDSAIADHTRALEISPKDATVYNNRGVAYHAKQQYDRAIVDYVKALEIDPYDAKAYINRGEAYAKLLQYDLAIADFTRAIEINPNDESAYNRRGLSHDSRGRYDQAIADFTKALEINPKYEDAYNNREVTYIRSGRHGKAIADTLEELYPTENQLKEPWQTSWDEFAKEVQRLYDSKAEQSEFIRRFNGKPILWEGRVFDVTPGKSPLVAMQMSRHRVTLLGGQFALMDVVNLPVKDGIKVESDKKSRFRARLSKGNTLSPAAVSYWQIKNPEKGAETGRIIVSLEEGSIE